MNLENYLACDELKQNLSSIKKVFFYRICGTGMGACACLLQEYGLQVEGADQAFYPPMSTYLDQVGVKCYNLNEISKEQLQNYDLIIVGNSVPRNSDHAKLIESCGVKFTSFPNILGVTILDDKNVIGIAGTHGKTTTTYFLTQMLNKLNEDTGYFIGGIVPGMPPGKIGKSQYFVIESDEYDSAYFQKIAKFINYKLNSMILTSLEFDHGDIYNSIEDIEKEFINVIPEISGSIISDVSYPASMKLQQQFPDKEWISYNDPTCGPYDVILSEGKTRFKLKWKNEEIAFETNIIGQHNILNISSCIFFLLSEGFEVNEVKKTVNNLAMVKRRQEERGVYKKSLVIDDFAHHPTAVKLTIDAIRNKYQKKIVTVFEPISATARSSIFQKEFETSLAGSDKVIIASNPLSTTIKTSKNLDANQIVENLKTQNIPAFTCYDLSSLRQTIDENIDENCLLLILSNRTCLGLWESDFVDELK